MASLNDIIKLTQSQYNTLKSGGTVSGLTYDANAVYLVEESQYINPNILLNSNFKINQRGKLSYTNTDNTDTYSVDRWIVRRGTLTYNPNGSCTHTRNITQQNTMILQYVENASTYLGYTFTMSAKVDNIIYTHTFTMPSTVPTSSGDISYSNYDKNGIRLRIYYNIGKNAFCYIVDSNSSITNQEYQIYWCKLELGNIATEYVNPLPQDELYKCQRYYTYIDWQYTNGLLTSSRTNYYISILLPRPMRITPTLDTVNYAPAWKGWLRQTAEISGTNHLSLQNVNNSNNHITFASGNGITIYNGTHNPLYIINTRTVATYVPSGSTTTVYDTNNSVISFEVKNLALDAEL